MDKDQYYQNLYLLPIFSFSSLCMLDYMHENGASLKERRGKIFAFQVPELPMMNMINYRATHYEHKNSLYEVKCTVDREQ